MAKVTNTLRDYDARCIVNALRMAARTFKDCADQCDAAQPANVGNRFAPVFRAQAQEARDLADRLEVAHAVNLLEDTP